jgi:hypothetical protein
LFWFFESNTGHQGSDHASDDMSATHSEPELPPRELAVRFTDTEKYPRHGLSDEWRSHGSISEASVYRLLNSHDLITSPAYTVIKGEG